MGNRTGLISRKQTEKMGTYIIWALIGIILVGNWLSHIFSNIDFDKIVIVTIIASILNVVQMIIINYIDKKYKDIYTNLWLSLRGIDAILIVFFIRFLDVKGELVFVVLILSVLLMFEENSRRAFAITVLFDLLYVVLVIFNLISLGNLSKDLPVFLIKVVTMLVLQLVCWVLADKVYAHFQEKDLLFEKVSAAYREIEITQAILTDRTKELEKSKEELEKSTDNLSQQNIKLSKNVAELFTMQEVSKFITSTLNIDELLNLVNDMILGIMGVNYTSILMVNLENKLDVVVSNIKEKSENDNMLMLFDNIIKQAMETKEPVLKTNQADLSFKEYNIGSVICIPLNIKGEMVGISIAAHENNGALNEDSLKFLSAIFNQISIAIENAKLYKNMQEMAEKDGLTKVYNRAYFQKAFSDLKNDKSIDKLAVSIFDIDFFKKFNDTYGHQFGDIVLQQVANIGKMYLVEGEFIARYGGEEFVIIFKDKDEDYVINKIEKIRQTIQDTEVTNEEITASVNASFGVAFYPRMYNGIDEHLLTCADDALYESKETGRNKVTIYHD